MEIYLNKCLKALQINTFKLNQQLIRQMSQI